MKGGWLGIAICAAALLAAGCSSGTDVSRAADESDTGTATGKASEATADMAATRLEVDRMAAEASAIKIGPTEEKKAYMSPDQVQSVPDGNREESESYMALKCVWGAVQDMAAYKEGHIRGAYHMSTDDIESEGYWSIRTPEEIKDLMAEYGITRDTTAICYSDEGTNSADDCVALTLLWAGVENVECLDGGYEAWLKSGYGAEETVNTPQPSDREFGTGVPVHPEYILSIDRVKDKLAENDNFKLTGIRSRDEFLDGASGCGYTDRVDESEGAVWGHDTDDGSCRNKDGATAGLDVLESYLEEPGASLDNELFLCCDTGWRATISFLIYYKNGMTNMAVYDRGRYQWQADDSLPVQVGDPAGSGCQFTTVGELSTDKAKKQRLIETSVVS